jgi:hypothetical protein
MPTNNKEVKTELNEASRIYSQENFDVAIPDSAFRVNSSNYLNRVIDLTGLIASCENDSLVENREVVAGEIIKAKERFSKSVLVSDNYTTDFTISGFEPDTIFVSRGIDIHDLTHLEHLKDGFWKRDSITSQDLEIAPGMYLRQHEDLGTFIEVTKNAPTQSVSIPLMKVIDDEIKAVVRLVYNNVNLSEELNAYNLIAIEKEAYQNLITRKQELKEENSILKTSLYDLNNEAENLANKLDGLESRFIVLDDNYKILNRNWVVSPSLGGMIDNNSNYFATFSLFGGLANGVEIGVHYGANVFENPDVNRSFEEVAESISRPFGELRYVVQNEEVSLKTPVNKFGGSLLIPINSSFKIGPVLGYTNLETITNLTNTQFQEVNDLRLNEQQDVFSRFDRSRELYGGLDAVLRRGNIDLGAMLTIDQNANLAAGARLGYNFGGVKK